MGIIKMVTNMLGVDFKQMISDENIQPLYEELQKKIIDFLKGIPLKNEEERSVALVFPDKNNEKLLIHIATLDSDNNFIRHIKTFESWNIIKSGADTLRNNLENIDFSKINLKDLKSIKNGK